MAKAMAGVMLTSILGEGFDSDGCEDLPSDGADGDAGGEKIRGCEMPIIMMIEVAMVLTPRAKIIMVPLMTAMVTIIIQNTEDDNDEKRVEYARRADNDDGDDDDFANVGWPTNQKQKKTYQGRFWARRRTADALPRSSGGQQPPPELGQRADLTFDKKPSRNALLEQTFLKMKMNLIFLKKIMCKL